MWDWWNNLGSKTSDFFKNNSDALSGAGALIGGFANAYGNYKQGKMNQKVHNLNVELLKEERRRRDRAEQNIESGWWSALAKKKEDEEKEKRSL
ncbi:hypothetical protein [Campylobacter sp. RM16188]|uniref:hypothetical protein n=1 Tax=Campylobacter sp. RM16188 TaxID=1705725 RepID=UPI001556B66C|nr:hypothetical protein [Campylobacter sp. RM16188]